MKTHDLLSAADEINEKTLRKRKTFFWILLICIVALFFIFACNGDGGGDSPTVIVTDDTPAPPVIPDPPPPDPDNEPVQAVLYTGTALNFFDGSVIWTWKTDATAKAETAVYSAANILYELDQYGQDVATHNLITTPDYIALDETDKWIVYNVPPCEAQAGGAMFKDYTKIYLNGSEYGAWGSRQYKTDRIVIINGDVYIRSEIGTRYHVNGDKTDVRIIVRDGFACYNYDSGARTATIDGIGVSWSTNFMNAARHWLGSGGVWYSQNGYTWDGATLDENGSVLTDWRTAPYLTGYTEAPVIIAAGINFENSETVLYFIECNSGWVIRYVPSTDTQTLCVRLYTGDGARTTGLYYQELLNPCCACGYLYFLFDANYYRYNFSTGLTGHFASGIPEVREY